MPTNDGGKGDKPRPLSISLEQFDANFDAIFGKKEPIPFAGFVDVEVTEISEIDDERDRNS
jgi:hypothetical protein